MLLIDTWGSPGDANNEEALFTRSSAEKQNVPLSSQSLPLAAWALRRGTAMIGPFVAISICA